jgi:hypothetical protein
MHTHHLNNNVPALRILQHGVTTARDLGSAEPMCRHYVYFSMA